MFGKYFIGFLVIGFVLCVLSDGIRVAPGFQGNFLPGPNTDDRLTDTDHTQHNGEEELTLNEEHPHEFTGEPEFHREQKDGQFKEQTTFGLTAPQENIDSIRWLPDLKNDTIPLHDGDLTHEAGNHGNQNQQQQENQEHQQQQESHHQQENQHQQQQENQEHQQQHHQQESQQQQENQHQQQQENQEHQQQQESQQQQENQHQQQQENQEHQQQESQQQQENQHQQQQENQEHHHQQQQKNQQHQQQQQITTELSPTLDTQTEEEKSGHDDSTESVLNLGEVTDSQPVNVPIINSGHNIQGFGTESIGNSPERSTQPTERQNVESGQNNIQGFGTEKYQGGEVDQTEAYVNLPEVTSGLPVDSGQHEIFPEGFVTEAIHREKIKQQTLDSAEIRHTEGVTYSQTEQNYPKSEQLGIITTPKTEPIYTEAHHEPIPTEWIKVNPKSFTDTNPLTDLTEEVPGAPNEGTSVPDLNQNHLTTGNAINENVFTEQDIHITSTPMNITVTEHLNNGGEEIDNNNIVNNKHGDKNGGTRSSKFPNIVEISPTTPKKGFLPDEPNFTLQISSSSVIKTTPMNSENSLEIRPSSSQASFLQENTYEMPENTPGIPENTPGASNIYEDTTKPSIQTSDLHPSQIVSVTSTTNVFAKATITSSMTPSQIEYTANSYQSTTKHGELPSSSSFTSSVVSSTSVVPTVSSRSYIQTSPTLHRFIHSSSVSTSHPSKVTVQASPSVAYLALTSDELIINGDKKKTKTTRQHSGPPTSATREHSSPATTTTRNQSGPPTSATKEHSGPPIFPTRPQSSPATSPTIQQSGPGTISTRQHSATPGTTPTRQNFVSNSGPHILSTRQHSGPTYQTRQNPIVRSSPIEQHSGTATISTRQHSSSHRNRTTMSVQLNVTTHFENRTTRIPSSAVIHSTVSVKTKNTKQDTQSGIKNPAKTTSPKPREKLPENESSVNTPTPSTYQPTVFIQISLRMTLQDFCSKKDIFTTELVKVIDTQGKVIEEKQVAFMNPPPFRCRGVPKPSEENDKLTEVKVDIYIKDSKGNADVELTESCATIIKPGFHKLETSHFKHRITKVELVPRNVETGHTAIPTKSKKMEPGVTIAVVIASVGGVCCITLLILQIIIHRRSGKRMKPYFPGTNRYSIRSLDSIALGVVPKSRPNSGFWNPGLEQEELPTSTEPSHPLGYNALSNFIQDLNEVDVEFETLPHPMPRLSCVPVGAEDKNRFANVIPYPHTRVKLKEIPNEENSTYINANYVTGYRHDYKAYIATQDPMKNTANDFWRMIWEQQSRVILMLTPMDELGQPRCSPYWPESDTANGRKNYGDYTVTLKKKDVTPEYTMSVLELKDIENNLLREIRHFWYTCWPIDGTPEPISFLKFVLDTRPHYEDSGAPVVVHCSPGTGRTGTFIALDICMRSYESKRTVNVANVVHRIRQERAGAVQTKGQYQLIYKALNEYATVMSSPSVSANSSVVTLHNML